MKSLSRWVILILPLLLIGCSTRSPQASPSLPTSTPQPTREVYLPTITPLATNTAVASGIPLPPEGSIYHGVFPGGSTGEEDDITFQHLLEYENLAGKNTTWVYFSNNWYQSRKFPIETATWIRNAGSIPYIRLMLRSELKFNGNEPVYTLSSILDGQFDQDLHAWCVDARSFGTPLLVEYGTEVNSDSFPWSGVANGAGQTDGYGDPTLPDGPERFRDAYRHIMQICRDEGAVNITWVFHVDSENHPDEAWNKVAYYYPGDEWIGWIGVSAYGTYSPTDTYYNIFRVSMDKIYPSIEKLAPNKPVIIAEFGTAKDNLFVDQIQWTRDALTDITSLRYPNVIGFSWWNEAWENGDGEQDTTMRLQDNPDLQKLFREMVGDNPKVIGEIWK